MKIILTLLFAATVLFGTTSIALAQTDDNKPRLFDQFNQFNHEYAAMVMDVFGQKLNNNPQTMAYIIVYGASSDCLFLDNPKTKKSELKRVIPRRDVAQRRINFYRNYMVNIRKFDPSRLVIIDGGYREKETTEFWLVSPGQDAPKPTPTVEEKDIKFRKGKIKRSDILGDC